MSSQVDMQVARAESRIRAKASGKNVMGEMQCFCCGKKVSVTQSGKLKQLTAMCQNCGLQIMARYPESQTKLAKLSKKVGKDDNNKEISTEEAAETPRKNRESGGDEPTGRTGKTFFG